MNPHFQKIFFVLIKEKGARIESIFENVIIITENPLEKKEHFVYFTKIIYRLFYLFFRHIRLFSLPNPLPEELEEKG